MCIDFVFTLVIVIIFVVVISAIRSSVLGLKVRLWEKWVDDIRSQRQQIGAHAPGKAEIKVQAVIDRVELAVAQEIEVVPFRVKGRTDIMQDRFCDGKDFSGDFRPALFLIRFQRCRCRPINLGRLNIRL